MELFQLSTAYSFEKGHLDKIIEFKEALKESNIAFEEVPAHKHSRSFGPQYVIAAPEQQKNKILEIHKTIYYV